MNFLSRVSILQPPGVAAATTGSSGPGVMQSCEPGVDGAPLQAVPMVTIQNCSHLLALQAEEAAAKPRQREQGLRAHTDLCRHCPVSPVPSPSSHQPGTVAEDELCVSSALPGWAWGSLPAGLLPRQQFHSSKFQSWSSFQLCLCNFNTFTAAPFPQHGVTPVSVTEHPEGWNRELQTHQEPQSSSASARAQPKGSNSTGTF